MISMNQTVDFFIGEIKSDKDKNAKEQNGGN